VTAEPRLAAAFPESATLGARLVASGLTVAVAESCTGGLLGAALTAVPGASRYVRGGIIAYADAAKVDLLGVDPELLARVGAVSPEVAAAMAQGAAQRLGADLGVAITGVAGPGAEGTAKPVGLIHIAGWLDGRAEAVELREDGDREANRAAAVRAALALGLLLAGGPAPGPAPTG
jgi:PncC family amidohydrolase